MSSRWSIDPALADAALERLSRAKTVLMPTHPNVDADGLATPLALMHMLAHRGVRAVPLVGDGEFSRSLRFLPGIENVVLYGKDPVPEYDLLCLLDCSDKRRLGAFYTDDPDRIENGKPIINIDHHVTNERYGEVAIVEPRATSTSEVLFRLMRMWDAPITPTIAQCLLAGIYGDTLALRDVGRPGRQRGQVRGGGVRRVGGLGEVPVERLLLGLELRHRATPRRLFAPIADHDTASSWNVKNRADSITGSPVRHLGVRSDCRIRPAAGSARRQLRRAPRPACTAAAAPAPRHPTGSPQGRPRAHAPAARAGT